MRSLPVMEFAHRIMVSALSAWIAWSAIIAIAAPYRPEGFLLILFMCSLVLVYLTCVWAVTPLISRQLWLLWKVIAQACVALVPFMLIVVFGHFIGLNVRNWFS
ncbi:MULTISPECIES: hypothetical protein [Undibacterium]|jgi:hypothetical protein|uniref:Uncharacterized protein n=1 Tax=Undibacterium aquatile TaxID=1537398 RepID=A0ABR6XCJ3_9BURK|nr:MULTISPECIES: hypothetical protein [Undibacterium]MBY0571423.1 hypothetical protein [Burkholderiaceae bacterium]MBC3810566.1 hypothetical protein [Undibacterium aquatile]MBC3878330.1 hypothetical protein [Undibacterium sp. FT79W]MBC3927342.1 hypothetical protein [Undibacterium sp. CY21W]MBK1889157.1 hypothetical protein [Undibacterium sp. 14-3-2]